MKSLFATKTAIKILNVNNDEYERKIKENVQPLVIRQLLGITF